MGRRFGHPCHYRIDGRDFPGRLDAAGLAPIAVDSRILLRPHLRRRFRVSRNHLLDCRRQ